LYDCTIEEVLGIDLHLRPCFYQHATGQCIYDRLKMFSPQPSLSARAVWRTNARVIATPPSKKYDAAFIFLARNNSIETYAIYECLHSYMCM